MKYILLALLPFAVSAGSLSTSTDVGATQSVTTGHSKGVVAYQSSDTSKSFAPGQYSAKNDSVSGIQKIKVNFASSEAGIYAGISTDVNGAEFGTMSKNSTYVSVADIKVKDNYQTSGYEVDKQWGAGGWSLEESSYNGNFKKVSNTLETASGAKSELTHYYYE